MAKKSNTFHVTKNPNGGWQVKREGASRASGVHNTKAEAVKAGRTIAKNEKGQLLIHKQNGQFQEERTYREDPFPPRG